MSQPLTEQDETQLTRTCRTAIGEELRSLTYFTPRDYEHLYLRDDLERGDDPLAFVETERNGFSSQRTYNWSELGDYQYNIRVFEMGYIVRVIADDRAAYVTVDPLSMDRFNELAEALSDVLRGLDTG